MRLQRIAARLETTKHEPRWNGAYTSIAEAYDPFLGPMRRSVRTVLEIGVERGGSLELWAKYFPRAQIWGVDRRKRHLRMAKGRIGVLIGDQGDPEFRDEIIRATGPLDLVVDDGSHQFDHQRDTLLHLWPHVRPGGLYIVEDVHTSYRERKYGGALRKPGTFMEWAKGLLDDVHWKVHGEEPELADLESVHVTFQAMLLRKWDR